MNWEEAKTFNIADSAQEFLNEIKDEQWFFLANADYVETSKIVIQDLIDAIHLLQKKVGKIDEKEPAQVTRIEFNPEIVRPEFLKTNSLTGNKVGGKIGIQGIGECIIEQVLPPTDTSEIERLIVTMPDGTKANLSIKQLNIGNDVVQ